MGEEEQQREWGRRELSSSEWQWRYLQGGVCVMKSLRTGWSRASALAADAAATAVALADAAAAGSSFDAVEDEQQQQRQLQQAASKLEAIDHDCVWVEREPLAWQVCMCPHTCCYTCVLIHATRSSASRSRGRYEDAFIAAFGHIYSSMGTHM